MSNSIYIKTENLNIGYGKRVIMEEINLDIKRGSIVSLIGPNGSGKSTLLKTIARQIKPLSGSITINGEDIQDISNNELARNVAQVFTDGMNKEKMSVRDVVSLGRYPYTGLLGKLSSEDEKIVDSVMKSTNVNDFADCDYLKISDGQRQRVLLARALCQEPKLLILDEPTTFLDVKYRLEFLSLLREESRQKNITVLMSLHELDMARQISDVIICLKDNKVDRMGIPDEIFEQGYINNLFDISIGRYDDERCRAVLQ